jgi:biotin carboxyl carrier protein
MTTIREQFGTLVIDGTAFETRIPRVARRPRRRLQDQTIVRAYLPGVIREVRVVAGREVCRGDSLLVLEAMKMQNDLRASCGGVVKKVHVAVGETVTKDQILVEIEERRSVV